MKKLKKAFWGCFLLLILCACGSAEQKDATKISFKQTLSYEDLKKLDGKSVTINGYLATSSPVDGSFAFLMNLPFQSCPFCVPNTSQLSNTIEIYPKKGDSFVYTNQAVRVNGTLVVASSEDDFFTDEYGYEFVFKIEDCEYTVLKEEELSEDIALWQKFSQTDIINEVNSMYDYVNFVCCWNTYFVDNSIDENGNVVPGFFLYAQDALREIGEGQYSYGHKEGYFEDIENRIKAVDGTAFDDLVENIKKAGELADEAYGALVNGEYACEERYLEQFHTTDYVYTLNDGEEYAARMDELYLEFSMWLSNWEL